MPIKFKVVKRSQAGIKGGGSTKYQAVATGREIIDTYELARDISVRCTLRTSDVWGVLVALSELIPEKLLNGHSVQLQHIGILSTSLDFPLNDNPDEINEYTIKGLRVQFRADKRLKKQLKDYSFTRDKE